VNNLLIPPRLIQPLAFIVIEVRNILGGSQNSDSKVRKEEQCDFPTILRKKIHNLIRSFLRAWSSFKFQVFFTREHIELEGFTFYFVVVVVKIDVSLKLKSKQKGSKIRFSLFLFIFSYCTPVTSTCGRKKSHRVADDHIFVILSCSKVLAKVEIGQMDQGQKRGRNWWPQYVKKILESTRHDSLN
jgi:hypothetical protein